MTKRTQQWLLLFALAVTLPFASPAHAQQCTNGLDLNDTPPPGDIVPFTWSNDFTALTRLVNHHMPSYGSGDSMTEPFAFRDGQMGTHPFGSAGPRETWYVSKTNLAGTAPFYRLIGGADHMDSDDPNEASSIGYQMEFPLGWPWTGSTLPPGMQPITRYLNPNNFDHRTWLPTATPIGYNPAPPAGYVVDRQWNAASGAPRYGYPRYGTRLRWCEVNDDVYTPGSPLNASIENTKWKVEFNPVWGNAIGRIYWKGHGTPIQLVVDDIGSMVQSTIFNTAPKYDANHNLVQNACCDYNPTQSGGLDIWNGPNTRRWAGSPVVSTSKTATSHVTEVKPFNFPFNLWTGTDQWSPLMWKGTFKRTTNVGLTIGGTSTTYQDVLYMGFDAKRDDTNVRADGHNLNNTHWLLMNPLGDGNPTGGGFKIERVTLSTGATQLVSLPAGRFDHANNTVTMPMDGRGVMFTKNDNTFAIGFHHNPTVPQTQNPVFQMMMWCSGTPAVGSTCNPANQTLVFNT
ncbi:MAG TPA: hypothetical protein VEU30_02790, partial [Thermoanaerobaculia bacterium]|nr:hypothetical protein [Thermoanaerobaculia bacterium]